MQYYLLDVLNQTRYTVLKVDVIYYVNYISGKYSYAEMMAGYSYATEMNCVIRNKDVEQIQKDMNTGEII